MQVTNNPPFIQHQQNAEDIESQIRVGATTFDRTKKAYAVGACGLGMSVTSMMTGQFIAINTQLSALKGSLIGYATMNFMALSFKILLCRIDLDDSDRLLGKKLLLTADLVQFVSALVFMGTVHYTDSLYQAGCLSVLAGFAASEVSCMVLRV